MHKILASILLGFSRSLFERLRFSINTIAFSPEILTDVRNSKWRKILLLSLYLTFYIHGVLPVSWE